MQSLFCNRWNTLRPTSMFCMAVEVFVVFIYSPGSHTIPVSLSTAINCYILSAEEDLK